MNALKTYSQRSQVQVLLSYETVSRKCRSKIFFLASYSLLTVECHAIAKMIPVCRSQKLRIIIGGKHGSRVPQYVHHIGTMQKGISFPCYLLLFWYNLIIIFWTTEETGFSENQYRLWSVKLRILKKTPNKPRDRLYFVCVNFSEWLGYGR